MSVAGSAEPAPPVDRRRRRLSYLVRICVAGGILAYLLSRVPVSKVVAAVTSADAGYLALAVGGLVVGRLAEAYRLRTLAAAQDMPLTLGQVLHVNLASVFYTLFVPGGTVAGGAVRLYKLSALRSRPAAALVTLVRDRLDTTTALAAVGLTFLILDRPSGALATTVVLAGALAGTVGLYLVVFGPRWRGRRSLPWPRVGFVERRLASLRVALRQTRTMPALLQLRVFGLSLLVHAAGVAVYWWLARSLDLQVPLLTLGWVRSGVILFTMLPVSLGGVGLREAAFLYLLTPYGVTQGQSLAFSFLVFVFAMLVVGAAGGSLELRALLGARIGRRPARSRFE
jgi:uncharacterized membrane protein YbhN (UPF0104 family)